MEKKKQIKKTFQKKQYWSWDQGETLLLLAAWSHVLFTYEWSLEVQGTRVGSHTAAQVQGWKLATTISCEGIRQEAEMLAELRVQCVDHSVNFTVESMTGSHWR